MSAKCWGVAWQCPSTGATNLGKPMVAFTDSKEQADSTCARLNERNPAFVHWPVYVPTGKEVDLPRGSYKTRSARRLPRTT